MENDKQDVAIKLIKLKEEITVVKKAGEDERRNMKKDLERKILEVKVLAVGNKKEIKQIWRRTDDNTDDLEKMQQILQTVFKVIVTTVIALLVTAIFNFTSRNL